MFKRCYVIIGLLILLAYVPALAQDDSPPPLGYASLNDYSNRYHVYDFNTDDVQTVERDEPLGEPTYYGAELPPDHVALQSPYDPTINFEFVATTPLEPNIHIAYNLYRLASDGTRQLITAHANVPYPAKDYWSPNGIYLYLKTDTELSGAVTLNQLDLRTNQLTPLKQSVSVLSNCQSGTSWCSIEERFLRDGPKYQRTLYVFNRDEGTLQTLGTSALPFTNIMWLGNSSELSANSQWLLIEAYLSKEKYGGLYALDLKTTAATPILLTEHLKHLSQSPVTSLRWLDNHTVIYSTYEKATGRSIYKATFPIGNIRELAHFDDAGFFDHDWSPDDRWLILSQSNTPATIYLISMDGGSREITLPLTDDQPVCVGWFSNQDYLSQKANLCDMNLGHG